MNKFTLGAVTGMSSLAVAVPLLATLSFAQSSSTPAEEIERAVPTQACLNARIDLESLHLAQIDTHIAEQKARMQQHIDALKEVAAIADEDERAAALEQMHEEKRDEFEKVKIEAPEDVKAAMEKVKSECGDVMVMHRGIGIGFPAMGKHVMKMRFGGEDGPVHLKKFVDGDEVHVEAFDVEVAE